MDKLLPCPFCGGEAVTSQGALAHNGSPWFYIECLTCAATAESPEVWNRRAQPEVAQGWRPIETAPKDGTKVDLWTSEGRRADCRWNAKRGEWEEMGIGGFDSWEWCSVQAPATHWMPLPEPPKEA